eukprot:7006212-Prymnesium_polylepis.1
MDCKSSEYAMRSSCRKVVVRVGAAIRIGMGVAKHPTRFCSSECSSWTEYGCPRTTSSCVLSCRISVAQAARRPQSVLTRSCLHREVIALPNALSTCRGTEPAAASCIGTRAWSTGSFKSCGAPSSLARHHSRATVSSPDSCRCCQSEKSAYWRLGGSRAGVDPLCNASQAMDSSRWIVSIEV